MASRSAGQDSLLGQTLGHYRVVEKIGAGGMGEVYRAHDERLTRDVALKILPLGTLVDEAARKHFHKEARILSHLNHPNVATIHDFDTQQGIDFLVMEYIEGITLDGRVAAGPLPEKDVVYLGVQLAEGLCAAHERGVVHRDLKPSNLRLTGDGRLKILDFGLAKLRLPVTASAPTESVSEMQPLAGTLVYMAPEQLLGGEADARTDIHAAGSILYEMATGHNPFSEVARSQIIGTILRKSPLSPNAFNPTLSPELERIIAKCLEKDPDDRYQSAKELAIDLQRLKRELYGAPGTETRRGILARRPVPHWGILALVGTGVLVLAIAGVLLWLGYVQKPGMSASIAVLPFADLSPGHDQEYFSDGLAEEILNDLARIPKLQVVARTSAFQFKGKNEAPRVIGRKLNVQNILEGSVRTEGNRVRITAQLINADSGFHLWSESYDRDLKDVFAVQADIAKAVTSALRVKLLAGGAPPLRVNGEAYRDFLQARYFESMGDKESTRKATEYVNAAIQAEPRYAAAYALRASLAITSGSMTWMNNSAAMASARSDIGKAMELDPHLADTYRVLSKVQSLNESNCQAAEKTMQRALELAPGDAENLGQSGFIAMCLGRQKEAVELLERAIALDPLQPKRYLRLAQNLRDLGRYEESQAALEKALELNPGKVWVHETRGEVFLAQGKPQEALDEMEKEPEVCLHDLGIALADHALGRRQESDAALTRLISQFPSQCAYQIAEVYAYRGNAERAFEWLDRAYKERDGGLMYFKTDLLLNSIRRDPRYSHMLTVLNLPN